MGIFSVGFYLSDCGDRPNSQQNPISHDNIVSLQVLKRGPDLQCFRGKALQLSLLVPWLLHLREYPSYYLLPLFLFH